MINSFGFIGHPIDLEHLYKMLGPFSSIAKKIPKYYIKEIMKSMPSYKLKTVKNIRSSKGVIIDAHTLICPMLPTDMVTLDERVVVKRIANAIKKSEKMGAKLAVLGGFTSVVGNEGEAVSRLVKIAVTSGNTYTASLAIDGIIKAAYYMDLNLSGATLAVIGATGDIGSICTKILAKKVKKVLLVARNEAKLNALAEILRAESAAEVKTVQHHGYAVKEADIILTVTSAVSALIDPKDLKPGAIVCDVAVPANVAKEIVHVRNDVFVFEGGLAKLPFSSEIKERVFNDLMPSGSIYGCFAEGAVLTFAGKFENYSIGRGNITEEKVNEISSLAKKHGLGLSDFFCGYKFYSEEDIDTIRKNATRNMIDGEFAKK